MHISNNLIQQLNSDGDKLILLNERGEPQGVLMSYTSYKALLQASAKRESQSANNSEKAFFYSKIPQGLTSGELLDKINAEIAQWREKENPISLDENYVAQNRYEEKKDDYRFDENSNFCEDSNDDDDETLYFETIDNE